MSKKIVTVPFGNKVALAEGLKAKSADKQGKFLVLSLLPMASSVIAGHPTFLALVKSNKASTTCPLQVAVATLSGKSRKARDTVFAAIRTASTQDEHDTLIAELESLIYEAMETAPRSPRSGPTSSELLKSENARLHAQVITITAERDALATERDALAAELYAMKMQHTNASARADKAETLCEQVTAERDALREKIAASATA